MNDDGVPMNRSAYSRRQLGLFLDAAHFEIAKYAQESFGTEGRGLVRIDAPDFPVTPDDTLIGYVACPMVYETLPHLRGLFADSEGSSREESDVVFRMLETYDPFSQAVVMVAFGQSNPFTLKLHLVRPLVGGSER